MNSEVLVLEPLQRIINLTIEYAKNRKIFGQRVIENQVSWITIDFEYISDYSENNFVRLFSQKKWSKKLNSVDSVPLSLFLSYLL